MNDDWKTSRLHALWDSVLRLVRDEKYKTDKSVLQVGIDILIDYRQLDEALRGTDIDEDSGTFRNFQISVTSYMIWQLVSLELIKWALGNICDLDQLLSDGSEFEPRDLLRAFLKLQLAIQP